MKFIIFDTCRKSHFDPYLCMFAKERISAYGSRKETVTVFDKGDIAFYYRNGIIGAGRIISDVIENGEEWYRNVELLTPQLKSERDIRCLSAAKLKQLVGHGFFFANTVKSPYLSLDETQTVLNFIRHLYGLPSIIL